MSTSTLVKLASLSSRHFLVPVGLWGQTGLRASLPFDLVDEPEPHGGIRSSLEGGHICKLKKIIVGESGQNKTCGFVAVKLTPWWFKYSTTLLWEDYVDYIDWRTEFVVWAGCAVNATVAMLMSLWACVILLKSSPTIELCFSLQILLTLLQSTNKMSSHGQGAWQRSNQLVGALWIGCSFMAVSLQPLFLKISKYLYVGNLFCRTHNWIQPQ